MRVVKAAVALALLVAVAGCSSSPKQVNTEEDFAICNAFSKVYYNVARMKQGELPQFKAEKMVVQSVKASNLPKTKAGETASNWAVEAVKTVYKSPSASPEFWQQYAFNACLQEAMKT